MKKFKLLSTILLLAILMSMLILPTMAIEQPSPGSNAVMLLDTATGNTLFEKNADTQVAPASLTKVMTIFLAMEALDRGDVTLTDSVIASENITYDLIEDGSTANIVVGEILEFKDLLYTAMLVSANEACNIIAEHVGGDIQSFIATMNARAVELGCTGTKFTNTHGLPASGHYTTARDMAIISMAAIANPQFMEIANTATYTVEPTNEAEARILENSNGLINPDSKPYPGYFYEHAAGVKTGRTDAAGYCLISTAKKDGVGLLCVVMGGIASPTADDAMSYGSFTDSIALYDWAFTNYSYRDVLKVTDLVADVPVVMGSDADFVSLHPQSSVKALLPNDDDLQSFVQNITIFNELGNEELTAPVQAGTVLGEITIEREGVIYGTIPLVASSSIGLSYSQFISDGILDALSNPFVIIVIIIVVLLTSFYVFLVVRYRLSRKRYVQQQRRHRRDDERIVIERQAVRNMPAPQEPVTVGRSAPQRAQYFEEPEDVTTATPRANSDSSEEQAERDYFEEFFGKK